MTTSTSLVDAAWAAMPCARSISEPFCSTSTSLVPSPEEPLTSLFFTSSASWMAHAAYTSKILFTTEVFTVVATALPKSAHTKLQNTIHAEIRLSEPQVLTVCETAEQSLRQAFCCRCTFLCEELPDMSVSAVINGCKRSRQTPMTDATGALNQCLMWVGTWFHCYFS